MNSTGDTRSKDLPPSPWGRIAAQCAARYERTTGKPFDPGVIDEVAITRAPAIESDDPVQWGFGRKAWATMRCTCEQCGRPGKTRSVPYGGFKVLCPGCQAPFVLRRALRQIVEDEPDTNGVGRKSVWHEHELPPLLRAVLPFHSWCQTQLPDGTQIRYVLASDVEALTPWFMRLAFLLEEEMLARIRSQPCDA